MPTNESPAMTLGRLVHQALADRLDHPTDEPTVGWDDDDEPATYHCDACGAEIVPEDDDEAAELADYDGELACTPKCARGLRAIANYESNRGY